MFTTLIKTHGNIDFGQDPDRPLLGFPDAGKLFEADTLPDLRRAVKSYISGSDQGYGEHIGSGALDLSEGVFCNGVKIGTFSYNLRLWIDGGLRSEVDETRYDPRRIMSELMGIAGGEPDSTTIGAAEIWADAEAFIGDEPITSGPSDSFTQMEQMIVSAIEKRLDGDWPIDGDMRALYAAVIAAHPDTPFTAIPDA
jgi:hypothetical protein